MPLPLGDQSASTSLSAHDAKMCLKITRNVKKELVPYQLSNIQAPVVVPAMCNQCVLMRKSGTLHI